MKKQISKTSISFSNVRKTATPSTAGFALIFAVLATSVLLSIGVAIFNIALRQVAISSFGRESQFAFYAADTGTECAMYWDFSADAFSTSSPHVINCGGADVLVGNGGDANPTSLISDIHLGLETEDPCVTVTVTKTYSGAVLITDIRSYGHNTCNLSSPTRVERGLYVTY